MIDDLELKKLARDIAKAAAAAPIEAAKIVEVGAHNVKDQARRNAKATAGTHAAQYPDTITYGLLGGLAAEIGPERRGQGHLGPILENGSVHNPPHRDLGNALDEEEPRFLAEAARLGTRWL